MVVWMKNRAWPLLRRVVAGWFNDDGMTLAASVAFYAAFSFFPLLVVLLSGLGMLVRWSEQALDQRQMLLDLVAQNTAPAVADQLRQIIISIETQASTSGPLGLITLFFGAMGVFLQIDASFDRIWKTPSPQTIGFVTLLRRVLVYRLKAFLMLLGLGLLVLSSFVVGMVLTGVDQLAASWSLEISTNWVQHALIILVNTLLFTTMYKTIPRTRVPLGPALVGGLFVALVWEAGRQVLAMFLIGSPLSAYGIIGTFVALMVWIYYASMVLFLGAELVHALHTPAVVEVHGPRQPPSIA